MEVWGRQHGRIVAHVCVCVNVSLPLTRTPLSFQVQAHAGITNAVVIRQPPHPAPVSSTGQALSRGGERGKETVPHMPSGRLQSGYA